MLEKGFFMMIYQLLSFLRGSERWLLLQYVVS